jgi:hypothetical protein
MTSIWHLRMSPCLARGTEFISRRARQLYPEIAVIVVSVYAPDLAECLDALDPPTVCL